MKIIRQPQQVTSTLYRMEFDYADSPGSGFSFDCDADGKIDLAKLPESAHKNLDGCLVGYLDTALRGRVEIMSRGIHRHDFSYTEPAVGECDVCGTEVELTNFTNTCHRCETDYNKSGQQLAPREQWGDETGESLGDILRIR